MEDDEKPKGDPLWIAVGFAFCVIGGIIGIGIGLNYAYGNYDKITKRYGYFMMVLGLVMMNVFRSMLRI